MDEPRSPEPEEGAGRVGDGVRDRRGRSRDSWFNAATAIAAFVTGLGAVMASYPLAHVLGVMGVVVAVFSIGHAALRLRTGAEEIAAFRFFTRVELPLAVMLLVLLGPLWCDLRLPSSPWAWVYGWTLAAIAAASIATRVVLAWNLEAIAPLGQVRRAVDVFLSLPTWRPRPTPPYDWANEESDDVDRIARGHVAVAVHRLALFVNAVITVILVVPLIGGIAYAADGRSVPPVIGGDDVVEQPANPPAGSGQGTQTATPTDGDPGSNVDAAPADDSYEAYCRGATAAPGDSPDGRIDALRGLWLGTTKTDTPGYLLAGCPVWPAQTIRGRDEVLSYQAGYDPVSAEMKSLGLVSLRFGPVMLFGDPARHVMAEIEDGMLPVVAPRIDVGEGDLIVVQVDGGTEALFRASKNLPYLTLCPKAVNYWADLMAKRHEMLWPKPDPQNAGRIVLSLRDDAIDRVATISCGIDGALQASPVAGPGVERPRYLTPEELLRAPHPNRRSG